jgi:predicted small lipoprotein YifL
MRNKVLAVMLSTVLVLSLTACGEKSEAAVSAQTETQESVAESESVSAETAETAATETTETATAEATETAETEGFAPGQSFDADGNLVLSYQFGTATVSDEEAVVVPNDTLDVNTKLYNDKTLDELCDYLEAEVMEEGSGLNRDFLCEMVAATVMDPSLMVNYDDYRESLTYCLALAEECYGISIDLLDLRFNLSDGNEDKLFLHVYYAGAEDGWVIDTAEGTYAVNNGEINVTTSMFDDERISAWEDALDTFYGEN